MKRPSLNALRTFAAAGRCLNFSYAAKELNISQAAVSQQIRKLEDYLGGALFIRQNRRLILTSSGQAYYSVVNQTIDRLNSVTDQLFPQTHKDVVTVSCSPSVATLWLAPHLGSMQKQYPNIEIRLNTLDYQFGKGQSSGADLDIIIQTQPDMDQNRTKLMSITITPVCAPGLQQRSLQKRDLKTKVFPVCAADILDFPLIHVLGYDDDWYQWFHCFGVKHTGQLDGLAFDGSLMAIEAALRGEGIMLGRRPFIDAYLESGDLIEVFSKSLGLTASCYLRINNANKNSRNLNIVIDWLKSLIKITD